MNYKVVVWNPFSDYLKRNVRVELAYPLMSDEQAIELFKRECPNSSNLHVWEFDSNDRPDLYKAFSDSDCIRFWKAY